MSDVGSIPLWKYTYSTSEPGWSLRLVDDAPEWAKEEYERQKRRWEYFHSPEGIEEFSKTIF